jgi:diguanylate cyclase (GGDEF)-like protein
MLLRAVVDTLTDGEPREANWTISSRAPARTLVGRVERLPGLPVRAVIAVRDRSYEIEIERNLRRTMLHDPLTALPNRTMFTEAVESALGRGGHAAVLTLNVDRFTSINESLGHTAGDELLIAFARRLLPSVRGGDVLARLSGDEFAILAHDIAGPDAAVQVAKRVSSELATPFGLSGRELNVTASIGVATTLTSARHAEELIRDSDFAMHRAKRIGGGRVELYQPTAHHVARDRFQLEGDLRRAVERDQLELHFQPLVDLGSGRLIGFEALARWHHPTRGAVSPVEFIPLAEETGLIVPIGRWALNAACAQLVHWQTQHGRAAERLMMGVNLSGTQLVRDDVVDAVESALRDTGLAADRLKLELTESVIIENPERTGAILARLKALGVTIAMDDFGTGYSSLSYLQRLPIDVLKIDRSFISGMAQSHDSYKIVTAVLSLAGSLGLDTVAEGIETPEQAAMLAALGCHVGQGFHFARPVPADEAEAYLVASAATA